MSKNFVPPAVRPGRPLAFMFEFLEVFSGASRGGHGAGLWSTYRPLNFSEIQHEASSLGGLDFTFAVFLFEGSPIGTSLCNLLSHAQACLTRSRPPVRPSDLRWERSGPQARSGCTCGRCE